MKLQNIFVPLLPPSRTYILCVFVLAFRSIVHTQSIQMRIQRFIVEVQTYMQNMPKEKKK